MNVRLVSTKVIVFSIAIIILLSGGIFGKLKAQVDPSSGDKFYVALPLDNQTVEGSVNIIWQMIDNDQTAIPVEINLFQKDCLANIGTIFSGSIKKSDNSFYKFVWTLGSPTKDLITIEDGEFCLEIKVTLQKNSVPAAFSDKRSIKIRNSSNVIPEVDFPVVTKNIILDQGFSYFVKTVDASEEKLTYEFVFSPSWLTLDKDTGELSGKANSVGAYLADIKIKDIKGGQTDQLVAINVNPQQSVNSSTTFEYSNLKSGDIISGEEYELRWSTEDKDELSQLTLEYSNNGSSWVSISDLQPSMRSLKWNTSKVVNGEYLFRMTTVDASSQKVKNYFLLGKIFLANEIAGKTQEVPSLYNISPLQDSIVEVLRPQISGEFLLPVGNKIAANSIEIFFNGVQLNNQCEISNTKFNCTLTRDLDSGIHKAKVSFQDEKGSMYDKDWTFRISTKQPIQQVDNQDNTAQPSGSFLGNLNTASIYLLLVICVVIFILLVIPWLLYLIWKKGAYEGYEKEDYIEPKNMLERQEPINPSDYQIGSQVISTESTITEPVFPSFEEEKVEQPDWLTDEGFPQSDISKASMPVTSEGRVASATQLKEDNLGSQPYGTYNSSNSSGNN